MSGGGKGGSKTSKTEIPKWLEEPAIRNLARAEDVTKIGYQPYYGIDVAGFTPTQQTAMQSGYDAAAAFGLAPQGGNAMAGMPQTQTIGGMTGYSSSPLFDQAVAEWQTRNPEQAAQYNALFGSDAINNQAAPVVEPVVTSNSGGRDWSNFS